MLEMDLIPDSYRQRMQFKRWCESTLLVLVLIAALLVAGRFLLNNQLQHINQQISVLQNNKALYLKQQQTYNELVVRQNRLQKNIELLNGLRGGPDVQEILLAIDRVLDGQVWFKRWIFNRDGEISYKPPEAVQTGYFIIIPKNTAGNSKQQTWKLDTHMTISGEAINHSVLSRFITRLITQPEIQDVQVINTSLRPYDDVQVVEFELAVIVNNQFGGKNVPD